MPKIYLTCVESGPEWFVGYALAEDGTGLASHISSSIGFAKHDMGLTSDWKHAEYWKHYPEGFELEWVDWEGRKTHEGFKAAYARNQAQKTKTEEAPDERE